jgi:regulator of sirC expression with transglutaminase-like and TPR domain
LRVDPELALFSHMVARSEQDIDLGQAALLIARTEYADLDISRYLAVFDSLGEDAKVELEKRGGDPVDRFIRWMFDDVGFQGNAVDYYDPRNNYLNDVIERRKGIPISLAVVILEVGRRAGIALAGVSFPGHFLLRTPPSSAEGRPVVIDPFDGQRLGRGELRALHARAVGEERDPEPALLAPATKRQILVRMLNNLRGIYGTRGDKVRLRGVLERMSVLVRSDELRRQLEQIGGTTPWPSGGHVLN